MPPERRLAAILFSDIVGYTALMAESEERGLRVRERNRSVVRPLLEQYHAERIEETGDEFFSVFPSAVDAVNCALAIQEALREDPELALRIGIHLGETLFESDRVYGDGVNVASRIRPLAAPGGICISDEVQHSIQNQPDIEAIPLGEQELKNVGRRVGVYAVGRPGAVVHRSARARVGLRSRGWSALAGVAVAVLALIAWRFWDQVVITSGPIRSIAVLPLENLSGDPEQLYVADGMTDALITELAKLPSLLVISRTSVTAYANTDKSLPEIAAELGVDGVVEGTVIREGDRIRVTAQLIDARSDAHLWADSFDREMSGVLDLQSDVARAIAEEIRLELTPEVHAALTTRPSVDPQAYDAYLRAFRLVGPLHLARFWAPRTIEELERAVELDPDFAEGWATLAAAHNALATVGMNLRYQSEFPKAREAAQRALELDARLGRAHSVLGTVRAVYDWDLSGAGHAFERAVQLSPSDPLVLGEYASHLLKVEGRTDEALGLAERILRVAPLDLLYRRQRVMLFYYARQYERALEEAERLRELFPDFVEDPDLASAYVMLGRFEEAYRAHIALYERCGAPCDPFREATERGWAEGGFEGMVRAWLEVATKVEGYSPWVIALQYAPIGESEQAFAWLERGFRERDPLMIHLKANPRFDPLRSDPRFDDLLRRIGFPES